MSVVIPFAKSDADIEEMLERAKELGFCSCVIVGVDATGRAFFATKARSNIELLGAVEAAKQHVWEAWG